MLQVLVELIQSGEVPENFAVFGLGFIMLLLGHLIFAIDLRHSLGLAWVLPMVAAAGAAVALAVEADPYHDIGLFVFEAAWVALGVAMLRRKPTDRRGLQQARLASPDRR